MPNRPGRAPVIANRELFGDLIEHEHFVHAYRSALDSLHKHGARATLEAIVDALG